MNIVQLSLGLDCEKPSSDKTIVCTVCSVPKPEGDYYTFRGRRHGSKCKSCLIQINVQTKRERRKKELELNPPIPYTPPTEKPCSKCSVILPMESFYRSKKEPCGRESQCKSCASKQKKARYEKLKLDPAKTLVEQKICTRCKQMLDSSHFKAFVAGSSGLSSWCKSCHGEDNRRYKRQNKVKVLAWANKRRAAKLQATPAWADFKAIEAVYQKAAQLTEETGIKHEVDHIIPLIHPLVQGLHVPENLQILTAKENMAKNNRFTPYVESDSR
jgi:hypothetical protein